LTSDLAVSWRRGNKITPRLLKTHDAGYLRDANVLIKIFEEFTGKTRGELERELEEYVGTGTDYRILRGFIKLLSDRSEFETASIAEPVEIRRKVFLEAGKFQPVLPDSKQKSEILQTVADEFQTDSETVFANLYSDLSAQQKLISFETISPPDLLDRYNLAQAQALLYKCVEMKISIAPSDAKNYRSIFGWIKHFGLIHTVQGNAANGYEITLTGAASLFNRSQKYGIRMAVFLPALLLCTDWKMSAEIAQKDGGNVFYELLSEQKDLNSCYFDEPEYENSDIEKLKKNWEKSSPDWQLTENREIVDLGRTAFIPDFVLSSPNGAKIYLDVLGFWTPKSLKKRLEEFQAANFQKFIFAASQELRGSREEPLWTSENVIFYKTKIEPKLLIETAEKLRFKIQDSGFEF
jgi:predicted nuclease of restriction endonuclease-like RecB superfamily